MKGYEKLAANIVKRAVIDYRVANMKLMTLSKQSKLLKITNRCKYERLKQKYNSEIEEIEQFIASPYFALLTEIDPGLLLKTLREEKYTYGCKKILKSG
jgi:mannitol-specific phosphotransferase system IIBC component